MAGFSFISLSPFSLLVSFLGKLKYLTSSSGDYRKRLPTGRGRSSYERRYEPSVE